MSQMPQLSACPSCEEPLESGDRFCGACGYDLSAVPERPQDNPTITMNGSVPAQGAPAGEYPERPPAPPAGAPWQAPGPADPQAPAAGGPMPPEAPPAAGVRFDRRPQPDGQAAPPETYQTQPDQMQPDEYLLQAPDPRVSAEPAAPAAGAGGKVCVACRAGRVDDDGYCENCGHAQPRERDHMEQESGPVAAVSDRGLRHHRNEDAFAIGTTALPDGTPASVAIVCDGVSSATRPDDASQAASRAASEAVLAALPRGAHPQQAMHDAIVAASRAVNSLAAEPATALEQAPHQNAPACTIVGAVVTSGLLIVGWVGDSRAYWVPVDRSAPPPGSPRTTRGPRRWSPRA